jgi:hypothetical protein
VQFLALSPEERGLIARGTTKLPPGIEFVKHLGCEFRLGLA